MRPKDTSAEAQAVLDRARAKLSGAERVRIAADLSEAVRTITRQGIRARHPDYSDHQVSLALLRILYGDELASKVAGGPLPDA